MRGRGEVRSLMVDEFVEKQRVQVGVAIVTILRYLVATGLLLPPITVYLFPLQPKMPLRPAVFDICSVYFLFSLYVFLRCLIYTIRSLLCTNPQLSLCSTFLVSLSYSFLGGNGISVFRTYRQIRTPSCKILGRREEGFCQSVQVYHRSSYVGCLSDHHFEPVLLAYKGQCIILVYIWIFVHALVVFKESRISLYGFLYPNDGIRCLGSTQLYNQGSANIFIKYCTLI